MTGFPTRRGCGPLWRRLSSTRRRLIQTSLLFALLLSVPVSAVAVEPTLDEIKREYRASVAALDPVWMHCRYSRTFDEEQPHRRRTNFANQLIEWAIDGEKFYFERRSDNTTTWESYDGKWTWAVDYGFASKGEDPRQAKCVRRQPLATKTDWEFRASVTPGWWLGMYFALGDTAQSGESVSTMLEKPSATLVGNEEVEGHECVRVDLRFRMLNDAEFPVTVWFDPAAGMLPRRMNLDWSHVGAAVDFIVGQFQTLTHRGQTLHLPAKMVRRYTSEKFPTSNLTQTVELVDVKLGEAVPAGLFKPELPKDVPVFDMDQKADRLEWQHHLAGETPEKQAARFESMRLQARSPAAAIPEGLEPTIVAQTGGNRWPMALFILGIVLLAGATVFTRRA